MHASEKTKHIHIHIPKTGGTSFGYILESSKLYQCNLNIIKLNGAHDNLDSVRVKEGGISIEEFYKTTIEEFYKTTTIRNPWEHAVSMYIDKFKTQNRFCAQNHVYKPKKGFHSFEEYIDLNYEHDKQTKYLNPKKAKFDKIFNYDDYNENISFLETKFNLKLKRNIRVNDRNDFEYHGNLNLKTPYQDYYDENTFAKISKMCETEIKLFNYKF
tara:strand:- start:456 stop:1097 length:642 start_codon:yes stop_codon:yes gene_type:complete